VKTTINEILVRAKRYIRIALVLFVIWTLVGLAFGAFGVIAVAADNRTDRPVMVFVDSMFRAYVWGLLAPFVYLFARYVAIDPRKLNYRAIGANLIFGVILTFLYPLIFVAVARASNENYFDLFPTLWAFLSRQVVLFGWYTLISLYVPTFLTVQTMLFLKNYRDEKARSASLEAELSRSQLSALKMQLHPHFLFNSLHSVSSLILVDPRRANTMVALLGDFLRQTLDRSNDQFVNLAQELAFLQCYLDIEKTRFDDRLSVNFHVDDAILDAEVPHLIMQPLVENAIKHGISPFSAPGIIEITGTREGERVLLKVKNSYGDRPGAAAPANNGFGLSNVRSRLENIYGDLAMLSTRDLNVEGFEVELVLPYRNGEAGTTRRETGNE